MLKNIEGFAILFAGVAALAMAFHVGASLLAFQISGSSLEGTLEIARHYYMLPLATLPLIAVQLRREHLRVDLFLGLMPTKMRRASDILSCLLMAAIAGVVVFYTGEVAVSETVRREMIETTNLAIPVWPVRWLIPFTYLMILIIALSQLTKPTPDESVGQTELE